MTQFTVMVALAIISVTVNLELRVNLQQATSSSPKPLRVASKKFQEREEAKPMNFSPHLIRPVFYGRPGGEEVANVVQYLWNVLLSGFKMTQFTVMVALAIISVTVNLELKITRLLLRALVLSKGVSGERFIIASRF